MRRTREVLLADSSGRYYSALYRHTLDHRKRGIPNRAHRPFLFHRHANPGKILPIFHFILMKTETGWLSRYSDWLRPGRPRGQVWVPIRSKFFSLDRSGTHPTSYPMGNGGSLSGGKTARAWRWPLTSIYSRGQENMGLYIHFPIRLHGVMLN
jgi:hypothetical protein